MNLKIIIISVIFILPLCTVSTTGIVNDPHRPHYSFSDEVFKNLPPYPPDLPEIRHLYATQTLQDYDRLTPEYYLQPEFYPGWFSICNKTYCRDPRIHGKFGAGFYPSEANIVIEKGASFELTTLLYTSPGVECYQGTMITLHYNKSLIDVKVVQPSKEEILNQTPYPELAYGKDKFFLLLEPTYPYFSEKWARKFKIIITALKPGNCTLKISNEKPPSVFDTYFKEKYGKFNYTSGNTFFGMQLPVFKANIKVVDSIQSSSFNYEIFADQFDYKLVLIIILLIALVLVWRWKIGKR
ncbi:MAG: hypothetical protein DRP18_03695 [Candidatus Aenigmatarchaeota archaeon]|nr:MAG: hypothetical protein DRP18_03695 [Candidatus Aenigmarchaeota archaeon]